MTVPLTNSAEQNI